MRCFLSIQVGQVKGIVKNKWKEEKQGENGVHKYETLLTSMNAFLAKNPVKEFEIDGHHTVAQMQNCKLFYKNWVTR